MRRSSRSRAPSTKAASARFPAILSGLARERAFSRKLFHPLVAGHYARKLIFRDPRERFVVVGMTWGIGHASPLHDHAGLWGAEIVVDGTMSETLFTLLERAADGRYRFEAGTHRIAEAGAVGLLIPPLEYHDFSNVGTNVARTLHVYGGDLTSSNAFARDPDGLWSARRVELHYDA